MVLDAKGAVLAGAAPGADQSENAVRLTLAEMLCKRVEAECAPVPQGALSQLGHDMLSYALASVDWLELADEWLEHLADLDRVDAQIARERGVNV